METHAELLARHQEKARSLEDIQRATLNILEDFDSERKRLERVQSATLNILEDFDAEKKRQEDVQRATLNILEDFNSEKDRSEQSQRALLNILEDIDVEKNKVAEVNQKLESMNKELGRRGGELEATNKELEAFTYSVSHDLRAPLRHVDGFSRLLLEEHSEQLDPEGKRMLERVRQGTQHMGEMVDDLLNLSRMSRREISPLVTDLNTIVQEVLTDLKSTLHDRQVEFRLDRLPFAQCDPGLIRQVFANLLSNAIKYSRPRERAVIEVGQTLKDGHRAVYVRDNGVGFSMKYADKLFGVFQRLHRAEDFEGSGVGLATVQRIIQKHGGRVWVEAEIDKGATFYFTLEALEDARTVSAGAVTEERPAKG
jgi:light-regulated signal transduction histidine kinase (bacteriophytochrome)